MLAPRWSTLTLLCLSILASVLGFYGGNFSGSARTPATLPANSSSFSATGVVSEPQRALMKNAPPTSISDDAEGVCRQLIAGRATPARNDELITALEKLAAQNPQLAVALAQGETSQRLRPRLLEAAFRGWGKADANAAAAWVLSQPENSLDRNAAIAAMLKGAVQSPDSAIELTQRLNRQSPEQARNYGDALIYALGQNGDFQRAADFAAAGEHPVEWLAAAYGNWANYQPQDAAASALRIADAKARRDALDAVVAGWGQADPKGLADFAMSTLPAGDQKTHALSDALIFLAGDNVVEAANWINQFGPLPEFDSGEAAIATQPDVMKQPLVAINWAKTINDPNFRSRTVAAIVETWLLSDPSGALGFVQSSGDLTPEDRAALGAKLNPPPN